jgi:hypothetical protein
MLVTIHLSAALDAQLRRLSLHTGQKTPTRTRTSKRAGPDTVLQSQAPSDVASGALQKLIKTHALALEPLFEAPIEESFSGIWHMRVPEQDAESIVAELLRIPGVEAAYSKPEDAPPEF